MPKLNRTQVVSLSTLSSVLGFDFAEALDPKGEGASE